MAARAPCCHLTEFDAKNHTIAHGRHSVCDNYYRSPQDRAIF